MVFRRGTDLPQLPKFKYSRKCPPGKYSGRKHLPPLPAQPSCAFRRWPCRKAFSHRRAQGENHQVAPPAPIPPPPPAPPPLPATRAPPSAPTLASLPDARCHGGAHRVTPEEIAAGLLIGRWIVPPDVFNRGGANPARSPVAVERRDKKKTRFS